MARENTVYLYGRLIADPKNRMDKENNPISSRMILQTLRRSYANDEMILQGKIIPDLLYGTYREYKIIYFKK